MKLLGQLFIGRVRHRTNYRTNRFRQVLTSNNRTSVTNMRAVIMTSRQSITKRKRSVTLRLRRGQRDGTVLLTYSNNKRLILTCRLISRITSFVASVIVSLTSSGLQLSTFPTTTNNR